MYTFIGGGYRRDQYVKPMKCVSTHMPKHQFVFASLIKDTETVCARKSEYITK